MGGGSRFGGPAAPVPRLSACLAALENADVPGAHPSQESSDSEYAEDMDMAEGDERPNAALGEAGPVKWECPREGCTKVMEVSCMCMRTGTIRAMQLCAARVAM